MKGRLQYVEMKRDKSWKETKRTWNRKQSKHQKTERKTKSRREQRKRKRAEDQRWKRKTKQTREKRNQGDKWRKKEREHRLQYVQQKVRKQINKRKTKSKEMNKFVFSVSPFDFYSFVFLKEIKEVTVQNQILEMKQVIGTLVTLKPEYLHKRLENIQAQVKSTEWKWKKDRTKERKCQERKKRKLDSWGKKAEKSKTSKHK